MIKLINTIKIKRMMQIDVLTKDDEDNEDGDEYDEIVDKKK